LRIRSSPAQMQRPGRAQPAGFRRRARLSNSARDLTRQAVAITRSVVYLNSIMFTKTISVRTRGRDELVDITAEVAAAVDESGVDDGVVTVYVPHTTAGVTINENADPSVVTDLLAALDVAVPWRQSFYRHGEGNSAAHVKSSMMGCSARILVQDGRLVLGTWQGIYFCEFDGPRSRQTIIAVQ